LSHKLGWQGRAIDIRLVGMLMTALIDYCEGGGDHDKTPFEYPLPNVDYRLNLRFSSRKREINRESSFSVVG